MKSVLPDQDDKDRKGGAQMSGISIRLATIEDVPVVHSMLTKLEKMLGATALVKRREEDLRRFGFSDTPCFQVLIAWRGGEAVGMALYFKEFSTWKGVAGVYVQDLFVSAGVRGMGLGSMLMTAVYEQAREWDASYCKLTVHDGNDGALAFYKRLGFRVTGNENVMVRDEF